MDDYCTSAEIVFASGPLLAVCSICPNVTLPLSGTGTNTTNETVNDRGEIIAQEHMLDISSIISTGLISYCSLVPACSQSGVCSTASLLGADGHFFRQGVANCWDHICSYYHATVNPDFGGFGARFQALDYMFSADHAPDDTLIFDAAFDCPAQSFVDRDVSSRQDLPIS